MFEIIGCFVEATIKDGQRDAFEAVMKEIVEKTSKEEGTLNYPYYAADMSAPIHGHRIVMDFFTHRLPHEYYFATHTWFLSANPAQRFITDCNYLRKHGRSIDSQGEGKFYQFTENLTGR